MRAGIYRIMEFLVFLIISVRIFGKVCGLTRPVRTIEGIVIGVRHAARRKPAAHGFEFGHHLEHFQQTLRRHFGHHGAAPRTHDDDAD